MQTSSPSDPALPPTLRERLKAILDPELIRLDKRLDSRLVKTFAALVEILLQNRTRCRPAALGTRGGSLPSALPQERSV
jgi:hypothetical protein